LTFLTVVQGERREPSFATNAPITLAERIEDAPAVTLPEAASRLGR
jgi:hypothetical protein